MKHKCGATYTVVGHHYATPIRYCKQCGEFEHERPKEEIIKVKKGVRKTPVRTETTLLRD
jgi:hypothetical protein